MGCHWHYLLSSPQPTSGGWRLHNKFLCSANNVKQFGVLSTHSDLLVQVRGGGGVQFISGQFFLLSREKCTVSHTLHFFCSSDYIRPFLFFCRAVSQGIRMECPHADPMQTHKGEEARQRQCPWWPMDSSIVIA